MESGKKQSRSYDDEDDGPGAGASKMLPDLTMALLTAPSDTKALTGDFNSLRLASGGSYVEARMALRRAAEEQAGQRARRLVSEHREVERSKELAGVVKISSTTGVPAFGNPILQQIARSKAAKFATGKPPPPPLMLPALPQRLTKEESRLIVREPSDADTTLVRYGLATDLKDRVTDPDAKPVTIARSAVKAVLLKNGLIDEVSIVPESYAKDEWLSAYCVRRRQREAEWWIYDEEAEFAQVQSDLIPLLLAAVEEDEAAAMWRVAHEERKWMTLFDYESRCYEAEVKKKGLKKLDYWADDGKQDERALCLIYHRPFQSEARKMLPAPPPWRENGATGAPCAPPVLATTEEEKRLGYRAAYLHSLACVGGRAPHLPVALEMTLHHQVGLHTLRLPRNAMRTFYTSSGLHGARCLTTLVELNCSANKLMELPFDFGLIKNLKICDLSSNTLTSLPNSFAKLEKLERLDLARNSFKALPVNIGNLHSLTWLCTRENMISEQSPTLPRLKSLKYYDLSSNGALHLGIQPVLSEVARTSTTEAADWHLRKTPLDDKPYYFNMVTHQITTNKPSALRTLTVLIKDDANKFRKHAVKSLVRFTSAYNERRRLLASRGQEEWMVGWSNEQACDTYTSRVNGEVVFGVMPDVLDTFGRLSPSLEELRCDSNQLHDLPPSFSKLTSLVKLRIRENFLRRLPEGIGGCFQLVDLDVASNEISELPRSLSKLVKLKRLSLQSNRLERLDPVILGKLVSLERLMLGNNSITTLPFVIGFLTTLVELQVFNNPLVDPPYESIANLPKMTWHCRQRYLMAMHGEVPEVVPQGKSIQNEILEPRPVYEARLQRMLEENNGDLVFRLENLDEIPGAVSKPVKISKRKDPEVEELKWTQPLLENLWSLKLVQNAFTRPPLFTESLTANLRVLWLKECKIAHLNDDVDCLQHLQELDLDGNCLTELPRTFTRLRRLERLRVTKNRLQFLPEQLGNLFLLTELDCSMNRLESVPISILKLKELHTLSLASNWLYEIPRLAPHLSKLEKLALDANELSQLPTGLGELPLRIIKASNNRIERLLAETFEPMTASTLEFIDLASNNLLELPTALSEAKNLKTVRVEYNPMRNPPAEMLAEGSEVLVEYCRLRDSRTKKLILMIEDFQFTCEPRHLSPETHECLTGKTGFLTPDDLHNFDAQVDSYLNGAYYTCSATDEEIMDRIDRLRQERQASFYHTLLEQLIKIITREVESHDKPQFRRFGPGILNEEMRPWGRKGEMVRVFCLSLDALVKDHPARGAFVHTARPSLFSMVKAELEETLFDYTLEVLKDAISKYEGAHGKVAHLDKVRYERCECVDDMGRAKTHRPCMLPSVVICSVIVTSAEAQRRNQEDDLVEKAWFDVWKSIDERLLRRQGRLQQSNELDQRRRSAHSVTDTARRKALTASKAVAKALEKLDYCERRKQKFTAGGDFTQHRIKTTGEADALVEDASEEYEMKRTKSKQLAKDLLLQQQRTKLPYPAQLQRTTTELKRKYCLVAFEEIQDEERRKAVKNEWRRPWDGFDGNAYKKWSKTYALPIQLGNENLRTLPPWVLKLQPPPPVEVKEDSEYNDEEDAATAVTRAESEAARLAAEATAEFPFNWDGTDDMVQFENTRYDAWEREAMAMGLGEDVQDTLLMEEFEKELIAKGKV